MTSKMTTGKIEEAMLRTDWSNIIFFNDIYGCLMTPCISRADFAILNYLRQDLSVIKWLSNKTNINWKLGAVWEERNVNQNEKKL